jgi:putative ABC transport system permease protein
VKILRTIWLRIRSLWQRREVKQEIDEELRFHLEQRTAENIAAGMSPEAAAREARKHFGNWQNIREECREIRCANWGEALLQDIRFGLRVLRKNPGFTAVAVLTLALGVGANTAIFSLINAYLIQPLPYPESERLVAIAERNDGGGFTSVAGGAYLDWSENARLFEGMASRRGADQNLTGGDQPVRILGAEITADYFRVLRIQPSLGRLFTPEEYSPAGEAHVVVLTDDLWRSQFQGDPAVIGRLIRLDEESFTVIGVIPARLLPNDNARFFRPVNLRAQPWKTSHDYNYVCSVIGRLAPGVSLQQAEAELNAIKKQRNAEYPPFMAKWGVAVQSLHEALYGGMRGPLLIMLSAVGAVLLIGCANVANLLLAKAAAREQEIAIRASLGASTGRIVRQMLTESLLLALGGGVVGVLLGAAALGPLIRLTGGSQPLTPVAIDGAVLAFSLAVTAATGLLFGLLPALRVRSASLAGNLKSGGRGSTAGPRRAQSLLIVSEIALTVMLLAGVGLLLRSFVNAYNAQRGFNAEGALIFDLSRSGSKVPSLDHRVAFVQELLQRLEALPGVTAAGMSTTLPLTGNGLDDQVSDEEKPETLNKFNTAYDCVAGNYFQAVGTPLLKGRFLTPADNSTNAPCVILVNQALAHMVFGDEEPLGRRLHFREHTWEIVGVVADVRHFQLAGDPYPHVYSAQVHFPWMTSFIVRTRGPPLSLAAAVRRVVREMDPDQPIANVSTLKEAVNQSLSGRRLMLLLLGSFAGVAVLLACVGIYGVMAFNVTQRSREFSIRLALGAQPRAILGLVLRNGLKLALLGVAIGVGASLAAGRVLSNQLYNVSAMDPAVLAIVALMLLLVAALASWLPARRAMKAEPMEALRCE